MLQIRDLLLGLIVEAISQASVNRMSQTHWGRGRKKSKKGGNCFVFGTKLPTRIFHQHFAYYFTDLLKYFKCCACV